MTVSLTYCGCMEGVGIVAFVRAGGLGGVSWSNIYECMKCKTGINLLYDTQAETTNKARLSYNIPRTA